MEYRRRSSSGGRNSAELGFRCSSVSPQVRCRQNARILNYINNDKNVEKAASKCAEEERVKEGFFCCELLRQRESNRSEANPARRGSDSSTRVSAREAHLLMMLFRRLACGTGRSSL